MASAPDYSRGIDAERALKFAVRHICEDRFLVIEGIIERAPEPGFPVGRWRGFRLRHRDCVITLCVHPHMVRSPEV